MGLVPMTANRKQGDPATSKSERPRCGAKTRAGGRCKAPAVWNREEDEPRGLGIPGCTPRLALVLEYLWWSGTRSDSEPEPEPEFVSSRAIQAAVYMFEGYFWPMAIRCYGPAGFGPGYAAAVPLARDLVAKNPIQINLRDIYKSRCVVGIRNGAAAQEAAQILCAMNWLRRSPTRQGPTRGRTTLDYAVNPRIALSDQWAVQ